MRPDQLFVPATDACTLYRHIPEGRKIARRLRPQGRTCTTEGCTTILSIYNRRSACWVHEKHYGERSVA